MPQTKLIYGVGRIPKASEFQLGEVIVNVDDSKVYSKNKSNVVFEIGTNNTGSSTTSAIAFSTASVFGSGFITASNVSNTLIISGGSGITVTTGSNNDLIISSQGDPDSDWFIDTVNGRLTASLDLLLTSSNQNQYIYFNSGNVNDITNIKNAYISNTISDTTYGQEIKLENYYNEGIIELEIGEKPFITAKKNANPVVVINDDVTNIDFNVKGDSDPSLIYANAGTNMVGIGSSNPGQKLSVNGNIYSNGYLLLQNKTNTTGVAGALLYSSSNEFYLGFSS